MLSTRGIRAGRAFVELFADDSKLVRGLRRAEKKLKAFGDRIRNLGLKIADLGAAMLTSMLGAAKEPGQMHVVNIRPRQPLDVAFDAEINAVKPSLNTGTGNEARRTRRAPIRRRAER